MAEEEPIVDFGFSAVTADEYERDKQYEIKWVWYHTILALELFVCNVLLFWIATVLTLGLLRG